MANGYFPTTPIELTLVGIEKGNTKIDVKKMVESIAIYESIRADSLSGTLTIRDGLDIISSLPIEGGETVSLEWKMTGKDIPNKQSFIIYKVSGQTFDTEAGVQVYTLNLTTKEKYLDVGLNMMKAYKGKYSDVVESVLKNKLSTDKNIVTTDSIGSNTFHSANRSPLELCSWMAKRSYDVSMSPFFFYENLDGYNFVGFKSLVDQSPVAEYTFNPALVTTKQINPDAIEEHYFNIQSMQILDSQDRLMQSKNGVFEDNVHTFNILTKKFTDSTFNISTNPRINSKQISDSMSGKRSLNRFDMVRFDGSHKALPVKNSVDQLLKENRIEVEVPGNDELRVGNILSIKIPRIEPRADVINYSPALSGKYIIHDLAHIFNGVAYVTHMLLVKDSREE